MARLFAVAGQGLRLRPGLRRAGGDRRNRRCADRRRHDLFNQPQVKLGQQVGPAVKAAIARHIDDIRAGLRTAQWVGRGQLQHAPVLFQHPLQLCRFAQRECTDRLRRVDAQRHLLAQKVGEVGHAVGPLCARQKVAHKVQDQPVVIARHIGVGEHVKIAHRQHAAHGPIGNCTAQHHSVETGQAVAQAAERRGRAAHLRHNRTADAAPAIEGDAAARQRLGLIRKLTLEKVGEVGVVGDRVVQVILVEDDVEGGCQLVGVAGRIALHVGVADQQQSPTVGDKAFDHGDFGGRVQEKWTDHDQRTGPCHLFFQLIRQVGEVGDLLQVGRVHRRQPKAQVKPLRRQRRRQRLKLRPLDQRIMRQIDDHRPGLQWGGRQRDHLPALSGRGRRDRRSRQRRSRNGRRRVAPRRVDRRRVDRRRCCPLLAHQAHCRRQQKQDQTGNQDQHPTRRRFHGVAFQSGRERSSEPAQVDDEDCAPFCKPFSTASPACLAGSC